MHRLSLAQDQRQSSFSGGRLTQIEQVEHRWTNTLPFLFAFFVNGQPIIVPSTSFDKDGGVAWMTPLVEKSGSRKWSVRVKAESLRALLPDLVRILLPWQRPSPTGSTKDSLTAL